MNWKGQMRSPCFGITTLLDAANFPFAAHTNKKLVQFVLRLCIRWLPEYVEDKYLFTTYLSNYVNLRKM